MSDAADEFVIDVKLHRIDDLFRSIDPSPLVERDLDNEIEEFIVDWARDAAHRATLRLVIHETSGEPFDAQGVRTSIANYFLYLRDRQTRRIRHLLREGRRALGVGAVFLIACSALGQALSSLVEGPAGATLREGLLIIGWVANWRPVEIFLYDWRPMRAQGQIYQRLADAAIEFRSDRRPAP